MGAPEQVSSTSGRIPKIEAKSSHGTQWCISHECNPYRCVEACACGREDKDVIPFGSAMILRGLPKAPLPEQLVLPFGPLQFQRAVGIVRHRI